MTQGVAGRSRTVINSASRVVVPLSDWRLIAGMESGSLNHLGSHRGRRLLRARATWRDAADIVSLRWDRFLRSEAPTRSFAFGSYVAALDAEEAAAAEISRLVTASAVSRVAA